MLFSINVQVHYLCRVFDCKGLFITERQALNVLFTHQRDPLRYVFEQLQYGSVPHLVTFNTLQGSSIFLETNNVIQGTNFLFKVINLIWELNIPNDGTRKLQNVCSFENGTAVHIVWEIMYKHSNGEIDWHHGITQVNLYQQSDIVQRVECFCTDTSMKAVCGSQYDHEITECYTISDEKTMIN